MPRLSIAQRRNYPQLRVEWNSTGEEKKVDSQNRPVVNEAPRNAEPPATWAKATDLSHIFAEWHEARKEDAIQQSKQRESISSCLFSFVFSVPVDHCLSLLPGQISLEVLYKFTLDNA